MPFDLEPVVRQTPRRSFSPAPDWDWLAKQEYSPSRNEFNYGNFRRGSLGGGPLFSQMLDAGDYRKYAVVPPAPPLTSAVLAGEQRDAKGRVGTISLNEVFPFDTLTQATGEAVGQDRPVIGDKGAFDPMLFLNQKGIDPFGAGATGLPVRLADYAIAFPLAVLNRLQGIKSAAPGSNPELPYKFQQDPGYWHAVTTMDEASLRQMARNVAAQYIDPARNGYLVEQLYSQFAADRNKWLGYTSGNDRIDYLAKLAYERDRVAQAEGYQRPTTSIEYHTGVVPFGVQGAELRYGVAGFLSAIPFVGTQLGGVLIGTDNEAGWQGLEADQRRAYMSEAGGTAGLTDIVASLPALAGMNVVLAAAKNAGGLVGAGYQVYSQALRGMNVVMASGIAAALTNWGLEAKWPGYSELLGDEVDRARPFSSSAAAAAINAAGFWSSGTFGGALAVKGAIRGARAVAGGAERAVTELTGGLPKMPAGPKTELQFYRVPFGGTQRRDELVGAGLDASGYNLSIKRTFTSYLHNYLEAIPRRNWEAALGGKKTGIDAIDNADQAVREQMASDDLARTADIGRTSTIAETITHLLTIARAPRALNPSLEERATRQVIDNLARSIDDQLSASYLREYGPGFITNLTGEYSVPAMRRWAESELAGLGGDPSKLGRHGLDGWAQIVRTLHNYHFDARNGELHAAMEGADEAERAAMFSQRSLFRQDVDEALSLLTGEDTTAAAAAVERLIRTKDQVQTWFAEWKPPAGVAKTPANAPASQLANWLEEVAPALPTRRLVVDPAASTALMPLNRFHAGLESEGRWTLGYKPVDENGQFVSYIRTRDGSIFKSPWLDYPVENLDNVELGNRTYMAAKLDSVFRGFRTWRLTEFQRGSLYRSITGRFPNVTPAQVDAFHSAILQIARDEKVNPQTLGLVPRWTPMTQTAQKRLQQTADDIFGAGLRDPVSGELVNWRHEVADAYRQSLRLNLTAGLTSSLKSNLGPIGEAIALTSDLIYVAWRFSLSPVFKLGEIVESGAFNVMRGVNPRGDPVTEALFYRGGIGNDFGVVGQELAFDQQIQGMRQIGETRHLPDPGARHAASLSFYARQIPDDFANLSEGAMTRGLADEGAASAAMYDDAIAGIRRDGESVDPETGAQVTIDDIPALEERGQIARMTPPPLPPLARGDRDRLLGQLRATFAVEPRPVQAHVNDLQQQLDEIVGQNGVYPGLEQRAIDILDELTSLDAQLIAERGPAVDRMSEIPGTPEAFEAGVAEAAAAGARDSRLASWMRSAWDTMRDPVPWKIEQQLKLQIRLMQDQFPSLLRATGQEGVIEVFKSLKIPERQWANWLLEDRKLLDEWHNAVHAGGDGAAEFDRLMQHSGAENRADWTELYQSEEWQTVSSLWALNIRATQDEAFGVHFFSPYRGAFERSINHPLLGIYPASWSIKAAREWARFLYQNQMLGDLRLGMAPAVAIHQVNQAQATAFAMANMDTPEVGGQPNTLDRFLYKGPMGSTLFIFNLLMPGDWSAIPFPASRTIREVLRGNADPGQILVSNVSYMGVTRDAIKGIESAGELWGLLAGRTEEEAKRKFRIWSIRGYDGAYGDSRR